jgi:ATP-binding cassette subfamily B protein
MSALGLNQWQQSGAFFLNEGKNIFITFLSAKAVMEGSMTLGTMLAVQYIIGQLNSPIEQMIGFIQGWQSAKISLDRLNEVQKMADEEPPEKKLLQELPRDFAMRLSGGRVQGPGLEREGIAEEGLVDEGLAGKGLAGKRLANDRIPETQGIRFSRVSFTYAGAGNEPVLRDIDLFIPAGKTTAIVGASGSGKTTLLKLLLRFYEPGTGDILLNNVPLAAISHKVWRSYCGAVMQESFIFSDSIAKNIAVGADEVIMSRLDEAARTANLQDFIRSLPLGYHTMIGAEWKGISMGQRQRLLIARAVYRDPAFIFFDEATNSLDANNESTILENLDTFFRKRTVVVVAHRLSTVRHADQIVVLSRGRITERGTHQELVGIKGEYFALVRKQLELDN